MAEAAVAPAKKGALKRGWWLVHLDESGFSQRPSVMRTWAPRGQTPIIRLAYNWKRLSAIGALAVAPDLSEVRTFQSYQAGSVDSASVIAFLRSLRRHVRAEVLLTWDRLGAHTSRQTQDWIATQRHWLHIEWLPAYAPELNPQEYVWSYLEGTDLANFCPDNLAQLERQARRGIRRVQRHDDLAFAFLKHSGLYPELYNVFRETQ